jgi:hypothetical protein
MPRLVASIADPTHWSKDYVEHLRAVHFGLVTLSAGLIILVLSSKGYDAATARAEIDEILRLKNAWSPAWIVQNAEHGSDVPTNSSSAKDTLPPHDLHIKDSDFLIRFTWVGSKEQQTYRCILPDENWHNLSKNFFVSPSPTKFPTTIRQFEYWWQELATQYRVAIPKQLDSSGSIVRPRNEKHLAMIGNFSIVDGHHQSEPVESEPVKLLLLGDKAYMGSVRGVSLWIPVIRESVYELTQEDITRTFESMKPGKFVDSFRDLAYASDKRGDLKLEELAVYIREEANKGPDVVEAFGLKIQSTQISLWGTVLVLGAQLYLFVYLRQLSGKLRADDPGWDVPWICTNPSGLAQTMSFFSISVLPATATFLLRRPLPTVPSLLWIRTHSDLSFLLHVLLEVVPMIGWALSLVLAGSCWGHRPKLTTKASCAVFE